MTRAMDNRAAGMYKPRVKGGPDVPLLRAFRDHPASVGETYAEHLRHAAGFGARMVLGGLACIVHGLLPFVFVRTGSTQIRTLHDHMVTGRNKTMPAILDFVI